MDNSQKLAVFQAQVENVRSLESAIKQVRRSINFALRRNDPPVTTSFTKIYAILFCAWAEANFSKLIHTPHGFSVDEIAQIQAEKSKGISFAWKRAIHLGVRHLDAKRGSFLPNARQRLLAAVDKHVFDPSLLRNKLAHGQWVKCLNRDNDNLQPDATRLVAELNIVRIDGWKDCHAQLAAMVESLVESPKRAFVRDWYQAVIDLDAAMEMSDNKDFAEHVSRLKAKDERTGAVRKRS